MLIIRAAQLEALRKGAREAFAEEVVPLLSREFPLAARLGGRAGMLRAVCAGLERAAAHGFGRRNDLYDFAHLTFLLGAELDDDPLLPWAAEVLSGKSMELLWDRTWTYVRRVNGPADTYGVRAMLRARRVPFETLAALTDFDPLLRRLHPRRCAAVTDAQFQTFIELGCAAASGHRIVPALWLALMLTLGSHFERDPLHAWAAESLAMPERDTLMRSRALHAAAAAQLDRALSGR
jgi:hypothetical protein